MPELQSTRTAGKVPAVADDAGERTALIRGQLEKILAGAGFRQSARMRRFLSFVVECSLIGDTDRLKESVIGVEVFDRAPSYDPKIEPIVRTEAHRLREKIREYYDREGMHDTVIVSMPKGGYVPAFEIAASPASKVIGFPGLALEEPPAAIAPSRNRLWAAGAIVLIGISIAVPMWLRRTPVPVPLLVPLTSFSGHALRPSLSPDGQRVAFVWDGGSGNFDIYVKLVNTGDPLRLTTNPAQDLDPAWSPDSRQIAFVRRSPGRQELYVIPALGGAERKIADLSAKQAQWAADGARYVRSLGPAWSPNGDRLAVANATSPNEPDSIYTIGVETGEKRRITNPNRADEADSEPVFSPRGDAIAFIRLKAGAGGSPEIFLQPLNGTDARRITFDHRQIAGVTWAPDGRRILFSSDRDGEFKLWQVGLKGGAPVPMPGAGTRAHQPSLSSDGRRLAFTERFYSTNMWRAPLGQPVSLPPAPFLSSARLDDSPQYSPDGRRVLFISNRAGPSQIWTSDADGSNAGPVGSLAGMLPGSPRWSPDGSEILFDSKHEGFGAIYATGASGGAARRLTPGDSSSMMASWSKDGRWIYYASDRSGTWQIWKQPMPGGSPAQVTRQGGREAKESLDGKLLYYTNNGPAGPGSLWQVPVDGGAETLVPGLESVNIGRQWVLAGGGCYYISRTPDPSGFGVIFFDLGTRVKTPVFPIATKPVSGTSGPTVSPDGRWLLYSQVNREGSNVMLLENFE